MRLSGRGNLWTDCNMNQHIDCLRQLCHDIESGDLVTSSETAFQVVEGIAAGALRLDEFGEVPPHVRLRVASLIVSEAYRYLKQEKKNGAKLEERPDLAQLAFAVAKLRSTVDALNRDGDADSA